MVAENGGIETTKAQEVRDYIIGSSIGAGIVLALLIAGALILPGDRLQMLRHVVMGSVIAITAIILLVGALLFVDHVTPGDFLGETVRGNTACAILSAAIIYVVGHLLGVIFGIGG